MASSEEYFGDLYHHQPHSSSSTAFSGGDESNMNLQMFDPNWYLTCFNGGYRSTDNHIISSSAVKEAAVGGGGETPATPNSSSISDQDSDKAGNKEEVNYKDMTHSCSNKDDKLAGKNKKTKKQREARFAFMTKSEVDHLEDGYRWRKYGQKAVKNSPFPRSYYRCTSQKCGVKKHVERSYQDPSIVITSYEGHHNHHVPAPTYRGSPNYNMGMQLGPTSCSFVPPHDHHQLLRVLLDETPHLYSSSINHVYDQNHPSSYSYDGQQQQFAQFPDYGLLQDIIPPPPLFPKQEEP